jgi:hypothetical protein
VLKKQFIVPPFLHKGLQLYIQLLTLKIQKLNLPFQKLQRPNAFLLSHIIPVFNFQALSWVYLLLGGGGALVPYRVGIDQYHEIQMKIFAYDPINQRLGDYMKHPV